MPANIGDVMDEEGKAKLVAKVLKGSPYTIDSAEELAYFFGVSSPDVPFSEAVKKFRLSGGKEFRIRLESKDEKS